MMSDGTLVTLATSVQHTLAIKALMLDRACVPGSPISDFLLSLYQEQDPSVTSLTRTQVWEFLAAHRGLWDLLSPNVADEELQSELNGATRVLSLSFSEAFFGIPPVMRSLRGRRSLIVCSPGDKESREILFGGLLFDPTVAISIDKLSRFWNLFFGGRGRYLDDNAPNEVPSRMFATGAEVFNENDASILLQLRLISRTWGIPLLECPDISKIPSADYVSVPDMTPRYSSGSRKPLRVSPTGITYRKP